MKCDPVLVKIRTSTIYLIPRWGQLHNIICFGLGYAVRALNSDPNLGPKRNSFYSLFQTNLYKSKTYFRRDEVRLPVAIKRACAI